MKRLSLSLAAIAALSASACAIRPAEMARPASLTTASATPITGIGGGERGSFAIGQNSGQFERSAQELSFFGLFNMKDGGASFSLQGADFAQGLQAACTMRERTVTIDIVEFKPAPMALGCDIRLASQPAAAVLEIQESAPDFTNRQQRRGVVMIEGVRLDIRSVHDMDGGILPASAPLGYVFERNGVAVGGVDINGGPAMIETAGLGPADHKAIMLASVALSVFWDPANLEI
jgi:hypothetical protein